MGFYCLVEMGNITWLQSWEITEVALDMYLGSFFMCPAHRHNLKISAKMRFSCLAEKSKPVSPYRVTGVVGIVGTPRSSIKY